MENASVIVCEKSSEGEISTGFVQQNVPAQSRVDVSGGPSSQFHQNRIRESKAMCSLFVVPMSYVQLCHNYPLLQFINLHPNRIVDSD